MAVDMLWFFEWLDASLLADVSKAYGGVFAVVQMFHLLGIALLGGMVLVGDLRLLNVVMKDVPSEVVIENTRKWMNLALLVMLVSGIFMASAVAIKLNYSEMFWAKMAYFATGLIFVYTIRRPLLKGNHSELSPWTLRLVAIASIIIWFNVAASGRWIGFS